MSLDNANFIAELSITDPPGADPLSQGDDQIRTIKRATFQSFPLIDKAVNLTADALNLAAIKNEANIFTVSLNQFTNQVNIKKSGATQLAGHFYLDENNFARWGLFLSTTANGNDFTLQRRDAAGVLLDLPWQVRASDGVVAMPNVPEVGGSPIWIAGEIRQFVIAAAPGGNWFLADGTNGTHNLVGRILINESAFGAVGADQNASLTSVTTATGVTGSTVLTEGQMPSHDHGILGGNVAGVSAGMAQANARGFMGQGSMTPQIIHTSGFGDNIVQNTGSSQGHTHTDGGNAMVIGQPGFSDSVRPLVTVVSSFQYVP